jgi:DNA-binding MarR family transcriptional regulator
MGQLAQAIDRDKSTVTVLVNKLAGLSYLEKRKDESDGRVTLIRLTEKGQRLEPVFKEISVGLIGKVYEGFTDLEQEILITLLDRIKNNL